MTIGLSTNRIRAFRVNAAITLLETLVAIAMLGVAASAGLWALVNMNNIAAESRLYTAAVTLAQNQIDLILSDTPFIPQSPYNEVPTELTVGTSSQTNVPIYTDPATNAVVVAGTVTTTVADSGRTINGNSLNLYQATVVVNYKFRNRVYNVVMSTMRPPDA